VKAVLPAWLAVPRRPIGALAQDQETRRRDGAGKLTDCATLLEAVLAWRALPSTQKIRATVKVIGGPVYTAHQIDRLHYGPKPPGQRMKRPRQSSYPMRIEEAEELAGELSEFGYRETDDPDEADRRRYYKVELRDSTETGRSFG
jgi:hypothetical protein